VGCRARPSGRPLGGVIFDLGGTLVTPTAAEEDGIRHLTAWLQAEGWPAAVADALRDARRWAWEQSAATGRQVTMQDALRRALGRFDRPLPDPAVLERAERRFFEPELAAYRPFPHAVALLRRLREAGLHVGCISNATSHWLIEAIVDRMGFRPYLDPVCSSAAFGRPKPDPGIFQAVLRRWALAPDRAAMVGDTLAADIAGGREVGMRTLYVTMAPNPENASHRQIRADAEAATLEEAERVLLCWAGAA
jgi:HAD superfamily hydrolase (TIGR01549 family)